MFIFKKKSDVGSNRYDNVDLVMRFSSDGTWLEALENFFKFLKGCGYILPPEFDKFDAEDALEYYIQGMTEKKTNDELTLD
jgi:hypothetical protein